MGPVWSFRNVGKTSQPLFHFTLHALSVYGTFSDAVITLPVPYQWQVNKYECEALVVAPVFHYSTTVNL